MNGYSLIWYLAIIVLVPTCVPAMEKEQSVLGKRAAIELYSDLQETDLLDLDEQRMAKTPRLETEKESLTPQLISIPTPLITTLNQNQTPVSTPALSVEGPLPASADSEKRYKCDYPDCIYAAKQKNSLVVHKLRHTGQKPFKCGYEGCDYATTQKSNLNKHKLSHAEEKPFKCTHPGCDFTTKHSSALKIHQLIHTGERRFGCNYEGCNFTAKRSSDLNRHKLTHTNERLYKCDYEGCDYAAKRRDILNKHKLLHTGEKPYKCDYEGCDYAAKQNKDLKKHIKVHSSERPYKCNYGGCNFATITNNSLNRHIIKTHIESSQYDYRDYVAKKSDNLNTYQLVHTNETPIECNYRNFTPKYHNFLNGHIQTQHPGQDIISIPTPIVASANQMTPATPLASVFEKIEREINMEEL